MTKLWECPKCKRKFEKKNQMHSCNIYPVEKHFKGKEEMKPLYNKLKERIKKNIGPFWVESLPCCIHFVTAPAYTFAAVYALKDRVRIHFGSSRMLGSSRIDRTAQVSANRYMHSVEIKDEKEIDSELLSWLEQAYRLKK